MIQGINERLAPKFISSQLINYNLLYAVEGLGEVQETNTQMITESVKVGKPSM
jgi:hypothetical protein